MAFQIQRTRRPDGSYKEEVIHQDADLDSIYRRFSDLRIDVQVTLDRFKAERKELDKEYEAAKKAYFDNPEDEEADNHYMEVMGQVDALDDHIDYLESVLDKIGD